MTLEGMANAEGRISFLSVGTKLLLKDSMDQYIRTLGDFKTHYASNMASALRLFQENTIHVVFMEMDLGDGSAFRLIQNLGGAGGDDDLYIILALEERSDQLMAFAHELEVDSVVIKPFNAADIKAQIELYRARRELPKAPWQLLLDEAKQCIREKKFRDAENNFKEAIAADPKNPTPTFKSALYYAGKPDFYDIAEGLLKKTIELKPDHVAAISALGSLYLARRDLDKADICFRKAQSISPLNPERMAEMVRLSIERSVEQCKAALRLDPHSVLARHYFGKLLAVQKDYPGAIRELEKLLPALVDPQKKEAQTFVALARKLGGLVK